MDKFSLNKQLTEPQGILKIILIIILLIAVLGFLNYFNIIPLSSTFPNQLGFLPHRLGQGSIKISQPTPDVGFGDLMPYASICKEFQKTQAKISCEKAIDLALAQAPGKVQKISIGQMVVPVISSSGAIERRKADMWLIDIVLTKPYFDAKYNKQIKILQVGIRMDEHNLIYKKPLE